MAIIRIVDIAHVSFSAPDLDRMQAFLDEFGMKTWRGPDGRLFGRGTGPAPFVHSTTLGEKAFTALGLRAAGVDDLKKLADAEGLAVEDFDAPGGGKVVRLCDPDGRLVEVVAGQTPAEVLPIEPDALRNSAGAKARIRASVRLRGGPASVVRIGHCVLEVSDFRRLEAWYKDKFGLLTSDEIEMAPGLAIGAFLRCDRGDLPSDHHTLFLLQTPNGPGFNHAAFEVAGADDLMRGHTHLKAHNHKPAWGIGRHILGSQIFDYWKDPFGFELEHWTDGDLFTADDPAGKATFQDLLGVQWGPAHPMLRGGAQ